MTSVNHWWVIYHKANIFASVPALALQTNKGQEQNALKHHFDFSLKMQEYRTGLLHPHPRAPPPEALCERGTGVCADAGWPAVHAAEGFRPHQPCLRAGCSLAHYTGVAEWSCTFNTAAGLQNRAWRSSTKEINSYQVRSPPVQRAFSFILFFLTRARETPCRTARSISNNGVFAEVGALARVQHYPGMRSKSTYLTPADRLTLFYQPAFFICIKCIFFTHMTVL